MGRVRKKANPVFSSEVYGKKVLYYVSVICCVGLFTKMSIFLGGGEGRGRERAHLHTYVGS